MSRKLMSVLMTLGLLSSVAIALTVTPPDFATDVIHRVYPTKADFDGIFAEVARPDFDWTFTEVETASTLDGSPRASSHAWCRHGWLNGRKYQATMIPKWCLLPTPWGGWWRAITSSVSKDGDTRENSSHLAPPTAAR